MDGIQKEQNDRISRLTDLKAMIALELKFQNNTLNGFKKSADNQFEQMKTHIEKEMDCRFSHQDEIVLNMNVFLEKFQNTLQVVSKDI
jgi:hypothetical protein